MPYSKVLQRTIEHFAKADAKPSRQSGVTGRDNYIIAKALAYAIVTIDNLPEGSQEVSDRDDMLKFLTSRFGVNLVEECISSAERHTGLCVTSV